MSLWDTCRRPRPPTTLPQIVGYPRQRKDLHFGLCPSEIAPTMTELWPSKVKGKMPVLVRAKKMRMNHLYKAVRPGEAVTLRHASVGVTSECGLSEGHPPPRVSREGEKIFDLRPKTFSIFFFFANYISLLWLTHKCLLSQILRFRVF